MIPLVVVIIAKLWCDYTTYMILTIYIQNLTTIGPVVSEIPCLIEIDIHARQTEKEITFFILSGS